MRVQGFGIVLLFPLSFCFHDLEQKRATKKAIFIIIIIKILIILFELNGLFYYLILRHVQVFIFSNFDHSCCLKNLTEFYFNFFPSLCVHGLKQKKKQKKSFYLFIYCKSILKICQ